MPRTRRYIPPNSAAHIMCRGNNKQMIFNNDSDKLFYWRLLHELSLDNKVDIFNYCIMNNHIHLITWITPESKLPKFMKQLNLFYYNYYRRLYGYCGHVWQGRYKSNLIETNTNLLQCGKYIELNPVRAGMVGLPEEYAFSSYRHYALGLKDAVVKESKTYLALAEHPNERRELYIKFIIDNSIIDSDKITKQAFIGSEDFVNKLRQYYGIKEPISKGGRPKKPKKTWGRFGS
jgi:putative transposase